MYNIGKKKTVRQNKKINCPLKTSLFFHTKLFFKKFIQQSAPAYISYSNFIYITNKIPRTAMNYYYFYFCNKKIKKIIFEFFMRHLSLLSIAMRDQYYFYKNHASRTLTIPSILFIQKNRGGHPLTMDREAI